MDPLCLSVLLRNNPFACLPDYPTAQRAKPNIEHAPRRAVPLNVEEKKHAVCNVLRYVPSRFRKQLAQEFAEELINYGHIYAFRYMPNFYLKACSIKQIACKCGQASAIVLMILNNLDADVAQFPQELVTYGGNGQVFSNWIQFRLTLRYLAEMDEQQTLAMYSGHPLGLFPSHPDAPRVVITNGMMIPNYSSKEFYDKFFALNVTMYGQMTAGSYSYIGPQGIVHGTTITLMSAVQKYLGRTSAESAGTVFVTSGLGGMSGAQAKATVIAGCVGVIAEISERALRKRHAQGWLDIWSRDLDDVVGWIKEYKAKKEAISIGYLGNVVDLWERLVEEPKHLVKLGSDQTSWHNPFNGGYYPVGLSFDEANELMANNTPKFVELVKKRCELDKDVFYATLPPFKSFPSGDCTSGTMGMHSWWSANGRVPTFCERMQKMAKRSYSLATYRTSWGGQAMPLTQERLLWQFFKNYIRIFPHFSDIFSLGFGPFRWVCASGLHVDLQMTDQIAIEVIEQLMANNKLNVQTREQYRNNLEWIRNAERHQLVVGSEARILYSDMWGRIALARAFNEAVRSGKLTVMEGRGGKA